MNRDSAALNWHEISSATALQQLGSDAAGLEERVAAERLQRHGPNALPAPPRRSAFARLLAQIHNILIYVLLGAAVITALLGHLVDTFVILAVVIANALIGFIQEGKAESAMEAIRHMLAPHATVVRAGKRRSIDGTCVVPGDIVLLEAGDKIPADLRLLQVRGLQVQEAILTGESLPVEKQTQPVARDVPLGDRSCMAYSGTLVTSGTARGVVTATGAATEIGRISGMLSTVEQLTTPLVRQMNVFAKWLSVLILVLAAILLAFGYFVAHYPFDEIFMVVVGLSVAAIPEGLPAVLTITLAIGVQAMARRNAIVRRLPVIETIGSVSVICTDKTGTLTRNEMLVASVVTAEQVFTVRGVGYEPQGDITLDGNRIDSNAHQTLNDLAVAAALCNDAALEQRDDTWTVEGDPMEGALLALAGKTVSDLPDRLSALTRTDVIPFDAKYRFMATLHHRQHGGAQVHVKGAPEQILSMCNLQREADGATRPIDPALWQQRAEEIAGRGQRVLAFAEKNVSHDHVVLTFSDVEHDMVLLGMVGMIDPPREEAIVAVAECRSAGIRVKMITGDHARTAAAIAKTIGLQNAIDVLTGVDLDALGDSELAHAVLRVDIFARTSPEHKLRLVTALQSHGMTVAMTGDGVNDAPALKRADAGIAMGLKGSEAAKEAADFVLADDNFASIAAAVREGRTVYDNIKKVISWTLPTNGGEAATIIAALLFGMALPVTPVQILWVNLITATTLGIALAFEPTEAGTMQRAPRARGEPLLGGELAWHITLVSALFLFGVFGIFTHAIDRGYSIELARTIALNTLVVMEIFHLFFIRNIHGTSLTWKAVRGTRVVWLTITIITVAQFAITYLVPLQAIFETEAIPFFDGLLIVAIGIALFAILEMEKQLRLALSRNASG